MYFTLQWRHNERDAVSNLRCLDWLLNRLFRHRSKKTSKLRVTGLWEGNPSVTGGFPHKGPVRQKCFRSVTSMMICVASSDDKDDLIHKPHNAPVSYPITHTFVTEIFLCFRCPCTYPPSPSIPIPIPTPTPHQSVYHACTQFHKKGVFLMGGANSWNPEKRGHFSGLSPRKG